MVQFNVTDPQANQILVWSELENAFINVEYIENNIILGGSNIGNQGSNIFHDVVGGNLRFKSIVAGDGLEINEFNTHIELVSTGTASSLNGFSSTDFMKTENPFSDINVTIARDNLDVYSTTESNALFMETNASNLPDSDNVYDLGSNGRRYAGVYAHTFHGTATNAALAEQLNRNNALDGQVLTWDDANFRWIPSNPIEMSITNAIDVYTDTLQDRSILRYNANRNRWEPELFEIGTGGSGGIADIENLGNGLAIYKNRTGFIANYRTLRSGTDINLRYNFNDDEIVIDANVPQNTDELVEGSDNLYYTTQRFTDAFNLSSITSLNDVQSGNPNINQGLLWNGSEFRFRNVAIDINSSNDIPEGNANLYYTDARVINVIDDYIITPGIASNQLSDVNSIHSISNILISDGAEWQSRNLVVSDLSDVDVTNISDFDVLVWDASNNTFDTSPLPQQLIDLSETSISQHFNDTSFNLKISAITSDQLSEGSINKYLSQTNLTNELLNVSIDTLIDVNLTGISNNNVLVWDALNSEFIVQSIDDVFSGGVSSLFELNEISFDIIDINDGDVLEWDSTTGSFTHSIRYDEISKLVDVSFNNLSSGESLVYNGSYFVNEPVLPFELTNPSIDQLLSWDGTKFTNVALGDIGSLDISVADLSDVAVNFTDLNNGDSLVWDDTVSAFVSGPSAQFIHIRDINGMDIDSINIEQTIRWDGFNFIPTNLPYFNPIQFNAGDVLVFDQTEGAFITQDKWEHLEIDYTNPVDNAIFIYDAIDSNFKVREIEINNLKDVSDINSDKVDQRDHILRWNDVDQSFDIHAPRIIVDIVNDLNDVDIVDIVDGHILVWDANDNKFKNTLYNTSMLEDVNITDLQENDILRWDGNNFVNSLPVIGLNDLNDVDVLSNIKVDGDILSWDADSNLFTLTRAINKLSNLSDVLQQTPLDHSMLSWDETTSLWKSSNKIIKNECISFNKNIYIEEIPPSEPTVENPFPNDGQEGTPFNFDELFVDLTYHYREIVSDIDFKIVLDGNKNDARFLILDFRNPSNYNITLSTIDEGDVLTPIDKGNDFSLSGNSLIILHSINGLDWIAYSYFHPIGNTLPSFAIDTVNDKEVFIYDDLSDEMVSRELTTDDIRGLPTIKNNNDLLVWDSGSSEYKSTNEIVGTLQKETYFSTDTITTTNIDPLLASYQFINSTVDTNYIINDITLDSNTAFKTTMIVNNNDNFLITFSPETTGNIEYISIVPENYNGKYKIDMLTFDGINWIFDVSEIV